MLRPATLIRRIRSRFSGNQFDAHSRLLLDWLNTGPTFGDERRFLQKHQELLGKDTDETLELLMEQYKAERETLDELRDKIQIVRDIRQRLLPNNPTTATRDEVIAAIADAYVNLHSGFVLDLPRWLRRIIRTSETLEQIPTSENVTQRRIVLWRTAYNQAERYNLALPIRAEICGRLHVALSEDLTQTRQVSLVEAIRLLDEALGYLPRERYPYLWASTQLTLGMLYRDRQDGDIANNIETAIECYELALEVFSEEDYPYDHASTLNNLANAYVTRPTTLHEGNLELAIISLRRALRIFTPEAYPTQWAMVQHNLANAYTERRRGDRTRNLEEAIICFKAALTQRTEQQAQNDWAESMHDLGGVYVLRIHGDHADNLRKALTCYEAALGVFSRERAPVNWAGIMHNMAVIHAELAATERSSSANNEFDTYFQRALEMYQPESFPADHRGTSLMRAEAHALLGQWELAHQAYTEALRTEDALIALANGALAQDAVLASARDGALNDAYALARLGRYEEAAIVVERGRARGLSAARALDAADPVRINDPNRRAEYIARRDAWRNALRTVQQPPASRLSDNEQRSAALDRSRTLAKARADFDATVAAIRKAHDPADFLLSDLTGEQLRTMIEQRLPPGHALVYLIATPWGGMALAILGAAPALGLPSRFDALMLPRLTTSFVADLIARDVQNRVKRTPGGFAYAQEGSGFGFIIQDWPGIPQAARVDALEDEWYSASIERLGQIEEELLQARMSGTLATSFEQLSAQFGADDSAATLRAAIEQVIAIPAFAPLVAVSFDSYDKTQRRLIENTLMYHLLRAELQHCREALADVAMRPLVKWLQAQRASSLTLIPCGNLTAFPLLSCQSDADNVTVADHLTATVAPSIRSLTIAQTHHAVERRGVYTLGNPLPTPQPLRWGQAEALCLAELAGDGSHAAIQYDASREWALEKMQAAQVFSASCHGTVDHAYLRSRLLLANRTTITLADALNGEITNLNGLRLLILSACQTAIPDLRGSRDEVRSLASGWLQAGAQAVLASLWPVDDRATFLLMVRFAQIWFPQMETLHPAHALAEAQQWLRERTFADLRAWGQQPGLRQALSAMPSRFPRVAPHDLDASDDLLELPAEASHGTMRGCGDYQLAPDEWESVGVDELSALESYAESRGALTSAAMDVRAFAARVRRDDARPYAHPYFWAGFQLTGW